MKKKLLACTLAALMCLQPASSVLAENLDFGDSAGIIAENDISPEENTEDISDSVSSEAESADIVSDTLSDTASDDSLSENSEEQNSSAPASEPDTSDSEISSTDTEAPADEITQDFSDDQADTLQQEPDDGSAADLEADFEDGSASSAGDSTTIDGFQYTTSGINATITKYNGAASEVTVPSKIGNYTVTKISDNAFADNLALTKVIISNTVTEIGNRVFSGCEALESVTLPSKLTKLGYSFISNTQITNLTIPTGLTSCGVNFSAGFGGPLAGAENLTELVIESGMETIPNNLAYFYNTSSSLTSVKIPDSVTHINNFAFYNNRKLTSITLPDGLQYIGTNAFQNCTSLKQITIPKNVKTIDNFAFDNCSSLSSLSFTQNPKTGFFLSIKDNAFSKCISLEDINFSTNINYLGYNVFSECSSLTSLNLPDNITEIGAKVFLDCSALESIKLPSKLKKLGYAFISGTPITSLTIPATLTSCSVNFSSGSGGPLAGAENLTDLTIESGMETIPNNLAYFYNTSSNLTSVKIPDSVTHINNFAFYNNRKLAFIALPDGLQYIGTNAFQNCTSLKQITIPKNVKTIDNFAFDNCSSLSSLSFTQNPKTGFSLSLKDNAFSRCISLEDINFSTNINYLGYNVFSECSSLTSLNLPDNITEIGAKVFLDCTALESIELPSKLKKLGYAFISGTPITSLTIPATLTSCSVNFSSNSGGPLAGAENLTDLTIGYGMENIPDHLAYFHNDTSHLTTVTIPDTVTSIGNYAFYNCKALEETYIPDTVTSIANTAFQGWKKLVIKGFAGTAAEAYARTNNIPFNEIIMEGTTYIPGYLEGVNAETGTITVDGKNYAVASDFNLTQATSILINSSDKMVVFTYENSRVTHMEEAAKLVYPYITVSFMKSSNRFTYENGQYKQSSQSGELKIACRFNKNSAYSKDELKRLLKDYTVTIIGIQMTPKAPLKARFNETMFSSSIEFPTPLKIKATETKTILTPVFSIASDFVPEKSTTELTAAFSIRYGDSASYIPSGSQSLYIENRDFARQQAEKRKEKTEPGQNLTKAKQMLNNNNILTLDPKLNDYLNQKQMEELYDFLSGYMAVAINSTSFSYTGDQKNKVSKKILENLFSKMGISKNNVLMFQKLTASFSVSADTKKGNRTINFSYSVDKYSYGDASIGAFGRLEYTISQDNISGTIGMASADMEAFAKQVKSVAEASVKNVYNEAWGKHADEVAEILFTKTVTDLMSHTKFGSFSNCVYTMYNKIAGSAKTPRTNTDATIDCPVDVYVYDSNHNLCGSIVNNVVDNSYNDIFMYVDGDSKYVSFCGDDYYLKLVGNDTGSMTYEVKEYDGDTLIRKIVYNDIPLTSGKTYNTFIPESQNLETGIYSPVDESGEKSEASSDTRETAPERIYVESIQLDQTEKSLMTGETFTLIPSVSPENATIKDVLWTSDNEAVATVDNTGTVKAHSAGTATITAKTFDGDFQAACTVNVTSPEISVDTLTVTVGDVYCNGKEQTPEVTVKNGGTLLTLDKDYKLTYSNNIKPGTATVTVTGMGSYTGSREITFQILEKAHKWSSWKTVKAATALKAGQKQRTCEYCGKTEKAAINKLKATIKFSMTSILLKKGQTTTAFKVTGLAKGDKVKSYSSANKKIATIDSRGKIKGIRPGSTKIIITLASGKKATAKIKVQKKAVATQKLTVAPPRLSLKVKKTYKLKISRTPLTTVEKITYKSSNSKIASVNSKGVITARKKGKATITILSGKKKATVKVTVK